MRQLITRKSQLCFLAAVLFLAMPVPAAMAQDAQSGIPGLSREQGIPTLAPMVKRAMPAVVNISARAKIDVAEDEMPSPFNDPMFRRFFRDFGLPRQQMPHQEMPRQRQARSIGSGVIVDGGQGYILTNHHVVRDADEIFVVLQDRRKLDAEIVGSDPETDIAVLKVDADNLQDLPLGDSAALDVGDFVAAIGNPFGLSHTVTSGIVSAKGRSGLGIEGYEDFIQTDASINPGNSGGALLNLHGELIGINTAIFSRTGGNMGIGFAIPIDMAEQVMSQLLEHGEIRRGKIGVQIQNVTPELADALDLDTLSGALVASVVEGSPAAKSGIEAGDVITSVNGEEVRSSAHLKNLVGLRERNEEIEVTVLRDGRERTYRVEISSPDIFEGPGGNGGVEQMRGASFAPLGPDHPLYGEVEGVLVSAVEYGSDVWSAGLREGDVIVSVNRKPVSSVSDFTRMMGESQDGALLNIRRGQAALFLVLQ